MSTKDPVADHPELPSGLYPPDRETDAPVLGARFDDAYAYASELHRNQIRKGSDTPYLSHLMTVAAITLEHGADEDVAIAALLHDAVEDQGGEPILEAIRERFGERVADIVLGCSDSTAAKGALKEPWRLRKDRYLGHFANTSPDVRLVSMADKLHNCRTTVADLHADGAATFVKFNASRDDIVWFYRAFANAAHLHAPGRLAAELERVVAELESLATA